MSSLGTAVRRVCWLAALALLAPTIAEAQGLLVNTAVDQSARLPRPWIGPTPPGLPEADAYRIRELDVSARVVDQVAQVQVTQAFVNTGSRVMEVSFVFPLPYDGAIDQLTLLVDGKEYPARLLDRDEARRTYEGIVRKNRDPALLEWVGTGMFQTSVFPVPPGAERKVVLKYSQLCRRTDGATDFLFPLATAKYTAGAIDRVRIQVQLESQATIQNVYSPTHALDVRREGKRATAVWEAKGIVPAGDFRLLFDVGAGDVATSLISYRPQGGDDGYFLLLASPKFGEPDAPVVRKSVVFVLDRSGSMAGQKIEQAKAALKFVVGRLRDNDLFNIVVYDGEVQTYRPELERSTAASRTEALAFVDGIYAGGSTNIHGALEAALGMLRDTNQPSYVVFLTDGLPTAGETNEMRIVADSQAANRVRARVISFGVGYDVNSRLLDRLSRAHHGQSEYVRPEEDIEARVARVYRRIEAPVLTDVTLSIDVEGAGGPTTNRVYPRETIDLFAGEQLVLVGRYKRGGAARVRVTGQLGGQTKQFDFPAQLAEESRESSNVFIERLWALRRVGEIIDELDLKGRNEELIRELVSLSTRHGIMTPYTSFLADESTNLGAVSANAAAAERKVRALDEAAGQSGFDQRLDKLALQTREQSFGESLLPGPAAPAATQPAAPGSGLASGGFRGGSVPATTPADAEPVRQVGAKTFFRRQGRWVDSTATEAQQQAPIRVVQFSDDYFRLAEKHGTKLAPYLALDGSVLVECDGQAYLIEPPTGN